MNIFPIISSVLLLDQLTKRFFYQVGVYQICDMFAFYPSWNSGVSFSMLSNMHASFMIIVTSALLAYVSYALFNARTYWDQMGLSLILAGGLGNLLDRIMFGRVFDFILFHYRQWSFPIFNIADISISLGVVVLLISWVINRKTR